MTPDDQEVTNQAGLTNHFLKGHNDSESHNWDLCVTWSTSSFVISAKGRNPVISRVPDCPVKPGYDKI